MGFKLIDHPEIETVNWMTHVVGGTCNVCGGEFLALDPISTIRATIICENCQAGIAVVERDDDGE